MSRIATNEEEIEKQKQAIERIGNRMNQILGAVVVTLIAAIANLLIRTG